MAKKIYFLRDTVAPKILCDSSCREFLINVIHKITNISLDELETLRLLDPKVAPSIYLSGRVADCLFETDHYIINIEVNSRYNDYYELKNINYIFDLVLRQTMSGDDFKMNSYKKVIQVDLDYFDFFHQNDISYDCQEMEKRLQLLSNDFYEKYRINMEKIGNMSYTKIKEREEMDLEWLLYIFVCKNIKMQEMLYSNNPMMRKVVKKMTNLTRAFDEALFYDPVELERKAREHDNELAIEKAHKQGLENGRDEITAIVRRNMLNNGFTEEEISKFFEPSKEEVKVLIK